MGLRNMDGSQPPLLPQGTDRQQSKRAERIVYPENRRYRRVRAISQLMDSSIVLPNGYRIGLDPILGLAPGIGDLIGTAISCYLIYESARLGLPKRVLLNMVLNVALEGLLGIFPVLGDIFDAAWKANMRNLRLLELHYHPAQPERSFGQIVLWLILVLVVIEAVLAGLILAAVKLVGSLFGN